MVIFGNNMPMYVLRHTSLIFTTYLSPLFTYITSIIKESHITFSDQFSGVARGGPGGARPHLIVLVPRLTFKYEKFLILIA